MIHFQAPRRLTGLVLASIALIALTVNACQPQKQAGPPEKITISYLTAFNTVFVH